MFAPEAIRSLEISTGRRRQVWKGAVAGALLGLVMGATERVDPADCDSSSGASCSRGEALATGAIALGLLGAGVGALIGTETWHAVSWDPRVTTASRRIPGWWPIAVERTAAGSSRLRPGLTFSIRF